MMRSGRRSFLRLFPLAAAAQALPAVAGGEEAAAPGGAPAEGLLVEAERFDDKGGWAVDAQFTHTMGAPFLLAHGLGRPVADAKTRIVLPEAGEWHIWVHTRDWAREWTQAAPGRFQVELDGEPLPATLGTRSRDWAWQKAGSRRLAAGAHTLALHDLTGFDGRCDALFLTREPNPSLPNDLTGLDAFRRRLGAIVPPRGTERFDLVVAGAGIAGICAAISAARLGLRVALVNDREILGGCNSSEIRVHLGGHLFVGPYPKLGAVVAEIGPARGGNAAPAERYEDARKMAAVRAEPNITLLAPYRLTAAEAADGTIRAVTVRHTETGAERRLAAPRFVDATGDGTLGALAGADFRYGRESRAETKERRAPETADRQVMGASIQWYSEKCPEAEGAFPDVEWGLPFDEQTCERVTMGEWEWETGMAWDQIADAERIRDYGLAVVYGNWNFLKNRAANRAAFAKRRLGWVAFLAGKRESRRLMGDVVLTANDIAARRAFPDACCCTSWTIDLHFPDPANAKRFRMPFKSVAIHSRFGGPWPIPYRCLYSRNIANLFMAGRDISVTHVALGTVRVMRTCGMMGEVVGMAAALCARHDLSPRGIYEHRLGDLQTLMAQGVGTGQPQPPQRYNMGG